MNVSVSASHYLDPAADALLARFPAPRRALFLDRDGVVNINHGYVHAPGQTTWVDGIFELCRGAHAAGYLPVIVTNQAGIARGYYSEAQFLAYTGWIHAQFAEQGAPLLATYYCPHHPTEGLGPLLRDCECRKPAPGMLLGAADDLGIDLGASVLVGDTDSDIQAATTAGLQQAKLFSGGDLPSFTEMFE